MARYSLGSISVATSSGVGSASFFIETDNANNVIAVECQRTSADVCPRVALYGPKLTGQARQVIAQLFDTPQLNTRVEINKQFWKVTLDADGEPVFPDYDLYW